MRPEAALDEGEKETTISDRSWVFWLASLCVLALLGCGIWGRMRMLEDDQDFLMHELEGEEAVHAQMETRLRKSLRKTMHSANRMLIAVSKAKKQVTHLQKSVQEVEAHVKTAEHESLEAVSREAQWQPPEECNGLAAFPVDAELGVLPEADLKSIFPQDILRNSTPLYRMLRSDSTYASLLDYTLCADKQGLFTHSSFPWAEWSWLRVMQRFPHLQGAISDFSFGTDGASLFLANVAQSRDAGFIVFRGNESISPANVTACSTFERTGTVVVERALPTSWPKEEKFDKLMFTRIGSDNYDTVKAALKMSYERMVDGGIISIDHFFHPTLGPKKGVEHFFETYHPGKVPLIFPVFPGSSVILFKGLFADSTEGESETLLDGNSYAFDLWRGAPEIGATLNQSLDHLQHLKNEHQTAQPAFKCWLAVLFQSGTVLRDFATSLPAQRVLFGNYNSLEIFRFMSSITRMIALGSLSLDMTQS